MSHNRRNKIIAISVIVLLVFCLIFLYLTAGNKGSAQAPAGAASGQNRQKVTGIVSSDTMGKSPPLPQVPPSARPRRARSGIAIRPPEAAAGIDTSEAEDTAETEDTAAEGAETADSTGGANARAGCAGDTAKPWVYPDPSGGLHRKAVSVTFVASKPCTIEWKADSAAPWIIYKGESIPVTTTTTLFFRAHDSCGNGMETREESYEVKPEDATKYCPENMEYINVGQSRFCIDKYEWPDKRGALPRSFISVYQAMDSCMSAEKHLCTSDEWTLACTGPHGWRYPYGATYEPHACITQDTAARQSGTKPECRGYFEVYDMSGNLAEWTNTKSSRNPQFYNVKGGFWESGPRSGCFDVRYSYYPQNRHNPVGFRCCKDARP
jgi:Sulfatase-modifying factor enzyme 1